MRQKSFDFSQCTLYILFAAASLFLFFIGKNGEPLPLALAYAVGSAGISPTVAAAVGFYPALFSGDPLFILITLAQVILLWVGFFLQERLRRADFRKSLFFPLFFFEAVLAEIHYLANGRLCFGSDLDQVEPGFLRKASCLRDGNNTDLITLRIYKADFTCFDFIVDERFSADN